MKIREILEKTIVKKSSAQIFFLLQIIYNYRPIQKYSYYKRMIKEYWYVIAKRFSEKVIQQNQKTKEIKLLQKILDDFLLHLEKNLNYKEFLNYLLVYNGMAIKQILNAKIIELILSLQENKDYNSDEFICQQYNNNEKIKLRISKLKKNQYLIESNYLVDTFQRNQKRRDYMNKSTADEEYCRFLSITSLQAIQLKNKRKKIYEARDINLRNCNSTYSFIWNPLEENSFSNIQKLIEIFSSDNSSKVYDIQKNQIKYLLQKKSNQQLIRNEIQPQYNLSQLYQMRTTKFREILDNHIKFDNEELQNQTKHPKDQSIKKNGVQIKINNKLTQNARIQRKASVILSQSQY